MLQLLTDRLTQSFHMPSIQPAISKLHLKTGLHHIEWVV